MQVHEELPDAGLGNRMSALVSVFALALLSDRALLVNWHHTPPHLHPDGEELISFPHIGQLFDPPGFDWRCAAPRPASYSVANKLRIVPTPPFMYPDVC